MADEIRCNVDDMASTFAQLLAEYGDNATKAISLAVEDEANDIRKKIRQDAGSAGIKGKRYKGGWQIKKEVRAAGAQCTIYNGTTPGLVHLLEKNALEPITSTPSGMTTFASEPRYLLSTVLPFIRRMPKLAGSYDWIAET